MLVEISFNKDQVPICACAVSSYLPNTTLPGSLAETFFEVAGQTVVLLPGVGATLQPCAMKPANCHGSSPSQFDGLMVWSMDCGNA